MKRFITAYVFVGLFLLPVQTQAFQDLESIRSAVEAFLAEHSKSRTSVRIEVSRLDPRLRLADCEQPPERFLPSGAHIPGNVTVGVRCGSIWTVYVPAKVQVYDRVVIASRSLSRGTVLSQQDLELAERDIGSLSGGYLIDLNAVVGKILKRNIQSGMPLDGGSLAEPKIVKRGERIQIVARGQALAVIMEGEALGDGAKGETIRVRNRSSRRELDGIVAEPGVVEIRY